MSQVLGEMAAETAADRLSRPDNRVTKVPTRLLENGLLLVLLGATTWLGGSTSMAGVTGTVNDLQTGMELLQQEVANLTAQRDVMRQNEVTMREELRSLRGEVTQLRIQLVQIQGYTATIAPGG